MYTEVEWFRLKYLSTKNFAQRFDTSAHTAFSLKYYDMPHVTTSQGLVSCSLRLQKRREGFKIKLERK